MIISDEFIQTAPGSLSGDLGAVMGPHVPIMGVNGSDSNPSFEYYYEKKMLGWNTPPEYQDYVDPFWKKFPAPNPALHYMLGFFYIIFTVASLIGNGVVMWVFVSAKHLRTSSNMLVVHLALCDFIMMLKTPVFIFNSFNEGPIWGKMGCDIYSAMGAYSGIGMSTSNAFIAYDRYKTIAKPFEPKMSKAQVMMIIVGIWIYASPFALLPAFNIWSRFVPEGFLTSCTFDYLTDSMETKLFVVCIFTAAYVIPAIGIIISYSKVYNHVRQHEKAMKEQAKKMNVSSLRSASPEDKEKSADIKILKVSVGIFFLFTISWLPYILIALHSCFGDRSGLTPLLAMVPACTCKLVACVDPWVYAISHPKYRLELQKRMPWFCIHEPTDDTTSEKSESSSAPAEKS